MVLIRDIWSDFKRIKNIFSRNECRYLFYISSTDKSAASNNIMGFLIWNLSHNQGIFDDLTEFQ